jgi:hypothetical protein
LSFWGDDVTFKNLLGSLFLADFTTFWTIENGTKEEEGGIR